MANEHYAKQAADQSRACAESIVSTVRGPLLVLDQDFRVVSANRAYCRRLFLPADGKTA